MIARHAGERGLSEDDLVAAIRTLLSDAAPGVTVGVGDDAAVLDPPSGALLFAADMLVEGIHFDRALASAHDIGAKAVVANVSDIAAMGGTPRHLVASLALSDELDASWVMDLYGGLLDAGNRYGAAIVGGDLSRGAVVVLSVAITGEVGPGRAVSRSGARPGDRVVVTGSLGGAAGGLALARSTPAATGPSSAGWGRPLLDRQFRPAARVDEGQALAGLGASAMIDVSDGLALDLWRLCAESGVGARIELSAIPVAPELRELERVLGVDPLELALGGGEDYELLAALPAVAVPEAAREVSRRHGTTLSDIGVVTEGRAVVAVDEAGTETSLEPKGWDHFAR